VSEFLDFARPKPLVKKATSVRALCERVLQLVAPSAVESGIELRSELPSTDIVAELDGAKMEQVLLNLLQNALEALQLGRGGRERDGAAPIGSVVCRALRQPRSVVIEVEDDGPGLPTADAPIFDPFFSTKPQGTGLGLAIAHRIVTDHDGAITAMTRQGKTVFRLTLPLPLSA
jgi:signal transduction histidine kinase